MSIKLGKKSRFKKVCLILTSHLRNYILCNKPRQSEWKHYVHGILPPLRDIFTKSAADIWYGNEENKMKYN